MSDSLPHVGPLAEPAPPASFVSPTPWPILPHRAPIRQKRAALRLLLIDGGEVHYRALWRRIALQRLRCDLCRATSLAEARLILRSPSFDVVLLTRLPSDAERRELALVTEGMPVLLVSDPWRQVHHREKQRGTPAGAHREAVEIAPADAVLPVLSLPLSADGGARAARRCDADNVAPSELGRGRVSADGRWLEVNAAFCEMVGYTAEELLSTDFQAIADPADVEVDLAQVCRLLDGQIDGYRLDKRYRHKTGHVVWALIEVTLHRDARDGPRELILEVQNITRARVDGRDSQGELPSARDVGADQSRRAAAENAVDVAKAFRALAGAVAHDFNNVLTAMFGHLQLAEIEAPAGADVGAHVKEALRACRRALDLVKKLQDFESAASGDAEPGLPGIAPKN
jgi:PAS domain S-box-containing protein